MGTTIPRSPQHRRFWTIADTFIASGRVIEGTMMGHYCLRAASNGGFVAIVERSTGDLVVKLPANQVRSLIATGEGIAFSPAGKTFREWVAVPAFDPDRWAGLIDEAIAFAAEG